MTNNNDIEIYETLIQSADDKLLKKHIRNGFLIGEFTPVPYRYGRERIWTTPTGYSVTAESSIDYHVVNNIRMPGRTRHNICVTVQKNNGRRVFMCNKNIFGEGINADKKVHEYENYVIKMLKKWFGIECSYL